MPLKRVDGEVGFVADSSLALAWAVQSQIDARTEELLHRIYTGARFVVPALWMIEVGNALLVLLRRKRIESEQYARSLILLGRLQPIIDTGATHRALSEVSCLAAEHGLTVYDAVYLDVALRLRLPLASRDAGLNRAAENCGVVTLL